MDSPYFVTCTGCHDLYLVCQRTNDAGVRIRHTATTNAAAKAFANSRNFDYHLHQIKEMLDEELTTDEAIVALADAVEQLDTIVRWDMDGYMARRRIEDAKNLTAGIVELEATA